MMTRKDFEAIASAIKSSEWSHFNSIEQADACKRQREGTARHIAGVLAASNPRFDMPRFLAACGVL